MLDSSQKNFSVINTDLQLIKRGENKLVKKIIQLNVNLNCSLEIVKGWIDCYIQQLYNCGISMPTIKDSFIENKSFVYISDYAGENVMQLFPNIEDLLTHNDIFEAICNILRLAQVNKLYIDPHPKNFVVLNGDVSYVDFSPPYQIKAYRDARLKTEPDPNKRKIIRDNFNVFHPDNIFYHFIGDFFNITENLELIKQIYEKVIKLKLVNSVVNIGIDRARKIRETEDLKFTHSIYLM